MMDTTQVMALKKGLIEAMKVSTDTADVALRFGDAQASAQLREHADRLYIAAKTLETLEKIGVL